MGDAAIGMWVCEHDGVLKICTFIDTYIQVCKQLYIYVTHARMCALPLPLVLVQHISNPKHSDSRRYNALVSCSEMWKIKNFKFTRNDSCSQRHKINACVRSSFRFNKGDIILARSQRKPCARPQSCNKQSPHRRAHTKLAAAAVSFNVIAGSWPLRHIESSVPQRFRTFFHWLVIGLIYFDALSISLKIYCNSTDAMRCIVPCVSAAGQFFLQAAIRAIIVRIRFAILFDLAIISSYMMYVCARVCIYVHNFHKNDEILLLFICSCVRCFSFSCSSASSVACDDGSKIYTRRWCRWWTCAATIL